MTVSYNYFTFQKPKRKNQDFIFVTNSLFVVLDGATPLSEEDHLHRFMEDFCMKLNNSLKKTNNLYESIEKTIKYLEKLYMNKDILSLPSAAGGIIHLKNESIEGAVFADVLILVETISGNVRLYYDDRIVKLDRIAIEKLHQWIGRGYSYEEAFSRIKPLLKEHRGEMCKKYSVIAPLKECTRDYVKFSLKTKNVGRILMMTDGFWEYALEFGLINKETDFLKYTFEDLIKLVINLRENAEKIDLSKVRVFDRYDDASVLDIMFIQ